MISQRNNRKSRSIKNIRIISTANCSPEFRSAHNSGQSTNTKNSPSAARLRYLRNMNTNTSQLKKSQKEDGLENKENININASKKIQKNSERTNSIGKGILKDQQKAKREPKKNCMEKNNRAQNRKTLAIQQYQQQIKNNDNESCFSFGEERQDLATKRQDNQTDQEDNESEPNHTLNEVDKLLRMLDELQKKHEVQNRILTSLESTHQEYLEAKSQNNALKSELLELKDLMKELLLERQELTDYYFYSHGDSQKKSHNNHYLSLNTK